jgi:hypothetical protein
MSLQKYAKRILGKRAIKLGIDIVNLMHRDARANFHLTAAKFYRNAFQALSFNQIDGDYVEFGCCKGTSFTIAHREARRAGYKCRFWAFDSFQGLPPGESEADRHPKWVEGAFHATLEKFHKTCKSNGMRKSDYVAVPGFYNESLGRMAEDDPPTNISLAYIDCDLYSSTATVLRFLMPRLKHGMIIAFDDYYCWSATQMAGERRACLEFFAENSPWALLPYLQFGWHGMSFVVESREFHDQLQGDYGHMASGVSKCPPQIGGRGIAEG